MTRKQVFYDTDCLSSFLGIDDWSILEFFFDEIIIPFGVYDELTSKSMPKYMLQNLQELVDKKFVKIEDIDPFSMDYEIYRDICEEYERKNIVSLGQGEAEAMALVISNDGILASNNFSDIKYFVDKYELCLLSSAYMIAYSVDKEFISKNKAKSIWKEMCKNGIRMPAPNFHNYYRGKYIEDYEDFGKRLDF